MPTIILREIECYDPKEIRDEPYIRVTADSLEATRVWGPANMRRGQTIGLTDQAEPIVYHDFAILALREEDPCHDDDYGARHFSRFSDAGLGNHYFPGELNARYRIGFELLSEPTEPTEGRIELLSLTCNDPQGTKDEITLWVNDVIVAGPMYKMKKDWAINFVDTVVPFRTVCIVRLRDTQGQDWERRLEINFGEYAIDAELSYPFIAEGRGIVGDARYTLRYRMLA